jgi:magnesium chelatase family protein
LEGHLVEIEVLSVANVPAFVLVGLPDAALGESRDRIRAAFASTQLPWPNKRVTVNLSPAALPKAGSGFDLGIAVAVMAACKMIKPETLAQTAHLGELGLDGRIRPIRGILPAVLCAARCGLRRVIVPQANLTEARLVEGIEVVGATSLASLAQTYGADLKAPAQACQPIDLPPAVPQAARPVGDLADVVGQNQARLAVEVAAAGGHHLMLSGTPGAGKTMLAERLPGLLPPLQPDQAVEVTTVHSVAGTFVPASGLILRPPFQAPHHTATPAAIIGGGSGLPRPGAVSLAHRGVLFLDEAPEFSPRVLQTLRQPLETGEIVIHRAAGSARYPARFQMVLAANPCPCGQAVGKAINCSCTPLARRRYYSRLSGPLLDRVDMHIDVEPVGSMGTSNGGESTAVVAKRVACARAAQTERLAQHGWLLNAEVPGGWLRRQLGPASTICRQLSRALDRGWLTMRGVDRVLRVAWTIADLAGRNTPNQADLDLAMTLRGGGVA